MGRLLALLFASSVAACGLSLVGSGPDGHEVSSSPTEPAPGADASGADAKASDAAASSTSEAAAPDATSADACLEDCEEGDKGKKK